MTQPLPLLGRRIVVTRARSKSSELGERLAALGAEPIELPVIEIAPPEDGYAALDRAIEQLADYDWLLFTSANGVEHFWQRLRAAGKGAEALRHLRVDLLPERFVAESLLAALEGEGIAGKRFLFPCAAAARETLPEGVAAAGGQVSAPHAYRTVAATPAAPLLAKLDAGVDLVTFLSGSAVRNFVELLDAPRLKQLTEKTLFATIGPVTAQAAQEAGLTVTIQAAEHSVPGLVDAIVRYYLEHDS